MDNKTANEIKEILHDLGKCEPKWAGLHSKHALTELLPLMTVKLPKRKNAETDLNSLSLQSIRQQAGEMHGWNKCINRICADNPHIKFEETNG